MLHRMPNKPYRNLFLATAIGLITGLLFFSSYLAIFRSSSFKQSLVLLADVIPVALLCLPIVATVSIVYGLPALWLALRVKLASPVAAVLLATLPGMVIWISNGMTGQVGWIALLISFCTGIAFVLLAYREPPSNNSFKPNPLRGSA